MANRRGQCLISLLITFWGIIIFSILQWKVAAFTALLIYEISVIVFAVAAQLKLYKRIFFVMVLSYIAIVPIIILLFLRGG